MRSLFVLFATLAMQAAQTAPSAKPPTPPVDPRKIAALMESGNCPAGFPLARRAYAAAPDATLKRRLGVSAVRCAMALNQPDDAAAFIAWLNKDFKGDPDILYLTVHTYSDLSLRASQALLFAHPDSYQVRQLNAEAMETQGRWDDAEHEYREVLRKNPQATGIHYRIGRLLLSKPASADITAQARAEFEAELALDPSNAGAEFVLGELARQAEQWPEAIEHFSRACQLDAGFADAFLGVGRSLLSAGRPADAIAPLETAVRLQPENPEPHFHLGNAYRKVGRKADADREYVVHQQLSEKARQANDERKKAFAGGTAATPPE